MSTEPADVLIVGAGASGGVVALRLAEAGFKASAFCPSYGLAEATLAVSLMPPGEGILLELVEESELSGVGTPDQERPRRFRAILNCGRPVSGMEVEIRGPSGAGLPDRGIGKDDTVSVMLANTPAMLEAHYAIPMTGAVLHSINTRLDPPVVAFMQHREEALQQLCMEVARAAMQSRGGVQCAVWDRAAPRLTPGWDCA